MSNLSSAFIDLATYGEAEKRMHSKEDVRPTLKQHIFILIPVLIILLILLKK